MNCRLRHWNARAAEKDGKKLTLTDRIIMLRSALTHSEFQFSERYGGVSFSSTLADGANGCRFKMIGYSHPKRWKENVIPLTDEQEDRIWAKACRMADCGGWRQTLLRMSYLMFDGEIVQGPLHIKYDKAGLLTHATKKAKTWWVNVIRFGVWGWTKIIKPDGKKVWCSEACAYLVKSEYPGFDGRADTLDPQELHEEAAAYFASVTAGPEVRIK